MWQNYHQFELMVIVFCRILAFFLYQLDYISKRRYNDQIDHRCKGSQTTQPSGQAQGCSGGANDTFNGIIRQLPKAPLGGACMALAGSVGYKACFITDPCKDSFTKAMVFTQCKNTFCNTSAESTKITGVGL